MSYDDESKDHVVLGKDPDYVQLTLLQFLKISLIDRFILRKQKNYSFNGGRLVELEPPKFYDLAIVLDGDVKDILRVNPQFADLLLATPTFVEVTESDHVHPGRTRYVGGQFITEQPSESS